MRTDFGKLENGKLIYAPDVIIDGNKHISTSNIEILNQYGYKAILIAPAPTDAVRYNLEYIDSDYTILGNWVPDLEKTRQYILDCITEYDESTYVNGFILGGVELWKDRDDRTALERAVDKWEAAGHDTYVLCDDAIGEIEIPISTMRQIFSEVELYAIKCMQVTFEHKQAVKQLQSINELMVYPYTSGYPDKPVFEL